MRKDYQRHHLSAMFGDMTEGEFNSLKKGIEINGIDDKHRVITMLDGQILDGWHRYQAVLAIQQNSLISESVDTRLEFEEYDGDDAAWFVLRNNFMRRNLSVGVRAAIVVEAYELQPHGGAYRNSNFECSIEHSKKMLSLQQMSDLADTGVMTIRRMRRLYTESPDIFNDVKTGEIKNVNAGIVKLDNRIKDEKRLKELEPLAPELAEKVKQKRLSLDAAYSQYNNRIKVANETNAWMRENQLNYPDIVERLANGEITLKKAKSEKRSENARRDSVVTWCNDNIEIRDLVDKVKSVQMTVRQADKELKRRHGTRAQVLNTLGDIEMADAVLQGQISVNEVELAIQHHLETAPADNSDSKSDEPPKTSEPKSVKDKIKDAVDNTVKEESFKDDDEEPLDIDVPYIVKLRNCIFSLARTIPHEAEKLGLGDVKALRRQFNRLLHPDKLELPKLTADQRKLWDYVVFQEFGRVLEQLEVYVKRVEGENDVSSNDEV